MKITKFDNSEEEKLLEKKVIIPICSKEEQDEIEKLYPDILTRKREGGEKHTLIWKRS